MSEAVAGLSGLGVSQLVGLTSDAHALLVPPNRPNRRHLMNPEKGVWPVEPLLAGILLGITPDCISRSRFVEALTGAAHWSPEEQQHLDVCRWCQRVLRVMNEDQVS